ncbi:MAG: CPBP family intramembrane metalloprotease [Lachnospiraceae bacterium]|nr:CPBP family intramembrane metalloprotease [Lachnospiraceae bacterium]
MQSPARINMAVFFLMIWFLTIPQVVGVVFILLDFNILVATGIGQVLGLGVPFFFYMLITKQNFKQILPWKGLSLKNVLLVVVISFAIIPMISLLSTLLSFVFASVIGDTLDSIHLLPMWMSILVIGVFPSIFEEVWFRGAMYKEYQAKKVPIFKIALVSALFFGFVHGNFQQGIYASVIGFLYAYIVHYTGSILAPMLGHFINNGMSVVMMYLSAGRDDSYFLGIPGNALLVMLVLSVIMLPVVILCMKLFRKDYIKNRVQQEVAVQEISEAESQMAESPEMTESGQGIESLQPSVARAKVKVFTWSFWAMLGLFLVVATFMELVFRLLPLLE